MTSNEFEEVIERITIESIMRKVAMEYLMASGPVGDSYIAKRINVERRQVGEARTALKKCYGVVFERNGRLKAYKYRVVLKGARKIVKPKAEALDLSSLATMHRVPPLCYFMGLAIPPASV